MRTLRLRVTLEDVEPVVVRVLDVPEAAVLPEVHDLLQAALGWTNSHLHQFVAGDKRYGVDSLDAPDDQWDESAVLLRSLPPRFEYLYDFGAGWSHDVEVMGGGGERPGCVAGENPCPAEDGGDPRGFDLARTDLLVRQTAGAVPEPVRLLLDLTAGGVKLTPRGRLPRAVARQVQARYPAWAFTERPVSREDDLLPLAALHDLLRGVGLLRLRAGVLKPTRAASDDIQVVRRLRSWFGPDETSFTAVLAGEAVAALVALGPCDSDALASRVFPRLEGPWMTTEGEPLTERTIELGLHQIGWTLIGLDLVEVRRGAHGGTWAPGPSALWLLPRATGLADIWGGGAL